MVRIRILLAFLILAFMILAAPTQAQILSDPPITDENGSEGPAVIDNLFRAIAPNPPIVSQSGLCFDLSTTAGNSLYGLDNGVFVYGGFHNGRPYAGVATSGGCPGYHR